MVKSRANELSVRYYRLWSEKSIAELRIKRSKDPNGEEESPRRTSVLQGVMFQIRDSLIDSESPLDAAGPQSPRALTMSRLSNDR